MGDPILLVTGNFPPDIGGPATFIDSLAHYLAKKGERVTVLCSSIGECDDSKRPFRVVRIPVRNLYSFEVWVRIRLFIEFVRHKRILVNSLDAYVRQVARIIPRRYFAKIVGDSAWERGRNLGVINDGIDEFQSAAAVPGFVTDMRAQRFRYLHSARKVVVPSRYLASMVVGWEIPSSKIEFIPNGCPDVLGSWPRATAPEGSEFRAVFVGRFTNWKGVETILLAMRDLPRLRLTLCGDGPLYPLLTSLAAQLGISSRVTFKGKVSREEIVAIMGGSHVLVLPSLYEGLSHTLLDGLRSGLPCIATAIGGNGEVIDKDVEGVLIPPADVDALKSAFEQVLAKWQSYSDAAFSRSSQFTFERCAEQYHKLLCE